MPAEDYRRASGPPDEAPPCDKPGCERLGVIAQTIYGLDEVPRVWHWCVFHDPEEPSEQCIRCGRVVVDPQEFTFGEGPEEDVWGFICPGCLTPEERRHP